MSLIGLCSVKGAPGATTLATALAAYGRTAGAVLIEADPAGGDLAVRYGIRQNPGLATLAARARHLAEPGRDVLADLTRRSEPGGFDLLPAPVEPAAATAALDTLSTWPETLTATARNRPILLDLGRMDPHSPSRGLIDACDTLCIVVRGDAVSLGHAREASWLGQARSRIGFVLVDSGPYRTKEAADALTLPCLGTVPFGRKQLSGRKGTKAVGKVWTKLLIAPCDQKPATSAAVTQVNSL